MSLGSGGTIGPGGHDVRLHNATDESSEAA